MSESNWLTTPTCDACGYDTFVGGRYRPATKPFLFWPGTPARVELWCDACKKRHWVKPGTATIEKKKPA
jgi:hypothetical protein